MHSPPATGLTLRLKLIAACGPDDVDLAVAAARRTYIAGSSVFSA